jgi:outer membrane lipopolysaccharide assembly protein LptE/RlpB
MLTSFRLQIIVVAAVLVRQQAVVRQQVALVRQQVAAAPQRVVAAPLERAAVVQRAFAGKIQQTKLCLPIQVALTFSFHLPPNEFCS